MPGVRAGASRRVRGRRSRGPTGRRGGRPSSGQTGRPTRSGRCGPTSPCSGRRPWRSRRRLPRPAFPTQDDRRVRSRHRGSLALLPVGRCQGPAVAVVGGWAGPWCMDGFGIVNGAWYARPYVSADRVGQPEATGSNPGARAGTGSRCRRSAFNFSRSSRDRACPQPTVSRMRSAVSAASDQSAVAVRALARCSSKESRALPPGARRLAPRRWRGRDGFGGFGGCSS
jgi:hypothetical protein